jgi:hypothetical protein
MSLFSEKLTNLEDRLQTLIEKGTTRVLPIANQQAGISSTVISAMESSIKSDESGQLIAADLYILFTDLETAQILEEDPLLKNEMSELILAAGKQSGVHFSRPPSIKISADASMEPVSINVLAQYSLQKVDETSTLTVSSDEGNPIPEYAFLIINGSQIFPLTEQVVNLGRRADNHVVIDDPGVSRVHAQLRAIKGRYVIFDLESLGGTFVNGVRLNQATLHPGDVISLAGVNIIYGQDAMYLSSDDHSSTQQLIPFPKNEDK